MRKKPLFTLEAFETALNFLPGHLEIKRRGGMGLMEGDLIIPYAHLRGVRIKPPRMGVLGRYIEFLTVDSTNPVWNQVHFLPDQWPFFEEIQPELQEFLNKCATDPKTQFTGFTVSARPLPKTDKTPSRPQKASRIVLIGGGFLALFLGSILIALGVEHFNKPSLSVIPAVNETRSLSGRVFFVPRTEYQALMAKLEASPDISAVLEPLVKSGKAVTLETGTQALILDVPLAGDSDAGYRVKILSGSQAGREASCGLLNLLPAPR